MGNNDTQPAETIYSAQTEHAPIQEPMRKVSIASMLAQHMDWLQFDVNGVNENVVQAHSRQALALSEIKADVRYVWIALLAVSAFLLVVAVMLGVVVYQLGVLIGPMR
jgi:hypothetical protein